MIKFEQYDLFNFNRLYGNEKYNLNEMEIKRTGNFPASVEQGKGTSKWSDRINDVWYGAKPKDMKSTLTGDAWWAGVFDEDFLKWANRIAWSIGFPHEVTAARIVRYTHGISGYPILRLDLASGGKGTCGYRKPKFDPMERMREHMMYGYEWPYND